jgi:uncharacterized protein
VEQQSHQSAKHKLGISIIVPVLDEGARLQFFVEHLRQRAANAEIIIVDAAESPCVAQSVRQFCDKVVTAPRGRAGQMNTGAGAASGDVLWFVHADCEVPYGCLDEIARTLEDRPVFGPSRSDSKATAAKQVVGGCFRIRFPRPELIYRVSDAGGNLAIELFGRCYGDHGIFCRRQDFVAVGGYPDLPVFEDAEFYRLLRKRGRTRQLASYIQPSPRRYEEIGPYRLTAAFLFLSGLYILRVPISLIARLYQGLCVIRE